MLSNPIFGQPDAEKQVADAVESLRKAMISGDSVALSRIAHEALSYGHSGGAVENKADFVRKISSGKSVFVKIDLSEQTIKIVGKTAIVRHKLVAETNDVGKGAATVKLSVLLIFQKDKDDWQLLARQAVKQS